MDVKLDVNYVLFLLNDLFERFSDWTYRVASQMKGDPNFIAKFSFSVFFFYLFIIIAYSIPGAVRRRRICAKIDQLANNTLELSAGQFLTMRKVTYGGRNRKSIALDHDFAGVYILHNTTKDKYYVGQSQKVFKRVYQHFSGSGNGDVYADYCRGDYFTVKMIALNNSGFSTLNELERCAIDRYDAYTKGYNKTRGNRG